MANRSITRPWIDRTKTANSRLVSSAVRHVSKMLLVLGMMSLSVNLCLGQGTTGQNATGTKPFWTYLKSRETISPSSGNVMVQIPLLHLPGRDGHDVNLAYTYNSVGHIYIQVDPGSPPGPNNNGPYATLLWQYLNPWTMGIPGVYSAGYGPIGTQPYSMYCAGARVVSADGASYSFGMADWGCAVGSTLYPDEDNPIAADDSLAGIILDGTAPLGPTAYFPNGERLVSTTTAQGVQETLDIDANGNEIAWPAGNNCTIVDTMNRKINGACDSTPSVQYYDSLGKLQTITINYGKGPLAATSVTIPQPTGVNLNTNCTQCVQWAPAAENWSNEGISSIVFPDGSTYVFQYDALGNLIKVGYPGGGYSRYEYAPFIRTYSLGTVPGVPSIAYGQQYQIVAKHECSDEGIPYGTTVMPVGPGGNTNTCSVAEINTTYAPTAEYAYNISNVVTTATTSTGATTNNSTITTYSFNPVGTSTPTSLGIGNQTNIVDMSPVELSHTTTDPSGNVLEQVTNTYESDMLHLKERDTTRLYGETVGEVWSNSSVSLGIAGAGRGYVGNTTPYYVWTVNSLSTYVAGNVVKREDYTYTSPGFNAATPYFFNLKATDDIYDPTVNGYISQSKYLYDGSSVVSSGVTTQHIAVGTLRGNVTSQLHWSSADNAFIGVTHVYDDAGNVVSSTDALNHTTDYSYTDAYADQTCLVAGAGPTAAYPTLVTNVEGQTASATYNSCTGTKASSKDANSQVTSYVYYPTDQLKSVSYPDGGQVAFCYNNTAPCTSPAPDPTARNFTLTTQLMTPDPTVSKEEDYDGLGRSIFTKIMSDPCRLTTATTYDTMERVWTKSFPYFALTSGTLCQATATPTLTTYLYNGLGEPTSQQVTGSPARTWTYSGLTEIETDEVGNKTTRTLDNLGRRASVVEPDQSTNAPTTETDYQYDAENNLKQVDQWAGAKGSTTDVKRTFSYDTLSRLTASTNPEVGTITYGYDKNSNLTSSTDARGITSTRSYDYLNRLTQTLYSDGTPTDCYYYDYPNNGGNGYAQSINSYPVGRLTAEATEDGNCQPVGFSGTTVLTFKLIGAPVGSTGPAGYDAMGRLVSDMQCPAGICVSPFVTQYQYDAGGQLDSQIVAGPTGPITLKHAYDAGGRELQVGSSLSDAKHPATLFAGSTWTACGMTAGQIGVLSPNPTISMTRTFDPQCRPASESDSAPAVAAVTAVQATATVNVSMTEQHTTSTGTPSTASITFAEPGGTDQYSAACSCYETGIFTLLVDVGQSGQVGYVAQDGTASSPTTLAAGLATSINANSSSLVTATSIGPTLYLTSKADGQAANYPFLIQGSVTDPNYFTTPSFTATASGSAMVGGSGGSQTTVYDSGTAKIAIGSLTPASISWTNADSASTIATRLAAAVTTADGSTVTATASGSQIQLKGVTAGTAANISFQTSTTFNTAYFSVSSVTMSGATALTGGANAIPAQSAGVIYQYSSGVWQPNGSLGSITDSILGTQSFTYDHLNRVTGAAFNGAKGNFSMAWSYDTYGNRKSESVSGTSSLTFTQPSPSSYLGASMQNGTPLTGVYNNRVDGQNYDKSGNFLGSQLTPAFTYDAASRIETAGGVCYLYNAEGLRTAKGTWSEGECLNITAQYVLGPGDAQLAEFDGAGNWKHTNVFGGGKLLATYDALGTHFHLNDWLGTARLQVGVSGAIDETCISLPFGDGLTCSGPVSEATEHHFTGKEHDAETGLDYFGARYFQDTAGRWMSPDWAAKAEPIPYAKMDNPQSLDLYAYVDNNPLSVADPDGHDPPPATCEATSGSCAATGAKANEHKKKTVTSHTTAQQKGRHAVNGGTAGKVYNETSTLRDNGNSVGPELHRARVAIAQVIDVNHSKESTAKPIVRDNLKDPVAAAAYRDSQAAVSEARTAPNGTQGAVNFFLDGGKTDKPSFAANGTVVEIFGPFTVAANTHDFNTDQSVTIEIIITHKQ